MRWSARAGRQLARRQVALSEVSEAPVLLVGSSYCQLRRPRFDDFTTKSGFKQVDLIKVPGSFEIPSLSAVELFTSSFNQKFCDNLIVSFTVALFQFPLCLGQI